MTRRNPTLALVLLLLAAPTAYAEKLGTPVTVEVVDAEGLPIPTAVVRHPEERDRHRRAAGPAIPWQASVLYLPDGTELVFQPGLELPLEISAPGYVNQRITHVVKKHRKRNIVTVQLQKMDFRSAESDDDRVIQFSRDHE